MIKKIPALLIAMLAWSLWAQPNLNEAPFNVQVTQHQITVDGQPLRYEAHTGYLVLRSEAGKDRAKVFFTAYTQSKIEDTTERPLTFVFNGGPGSSSVWLHMGGLGPKRVKMQADGRPVAPPYGYEDNPETWLDLTDMVFIDPMMTGYTRPMGDAEKEEFLGFQQDLELVGQFIQTYLSRYERWGSPKFLAGESYGTTRAAGLSGYLQSRYGIFLNGITLISSVLDFSTLIDARGNDLAPLTLLPTLAATAWYHDQVGEEFDTVEGLLAEVEEFVMGDYALALLKGDAISPEEKQQTIEQLHRFTGLDTGYLADVNLRLSVGSFNKELLRDQGVTVGRLDGRFTGIDYQDAGDRYEFDPSYDYLIYGSFTTAINDYLRRELGYRNDLPYEILTGRVRPWPFGAAASNRYLNVAETLRQAMTRNPEMKVWVASGYYDLATPYFAADYVLDHMFLRGGLKDNVRVTYYPAGHMVYIHEPSLRQLKQDAQSFYQSAH